MIVVSTLTTLTLQRAEDLLIRYLMIYKSCRNPEEREEVRELVEACQARIEILMAKTEPPQ